MRFQCHREKSPCADRPFEENGIIVVEPPVFGHAGSTDAGKKQMIFATSEIGKLNKLIFKWVRSGRLTEAEFERYTSMLIEGNPHASAASSKH